MNAETPHIKAKILVCIDGGEASKIALYFACLKAKKRGGLLDIIHVIPPSDFEGLQGVADKIRRDTRAAAEELLQQMSQIAQDKAGIVPSLILREGPIGQEIIKVVEEDNEANMLVLAASNPGAGHGKLIGWLAAKLGADLQVPMVVVPGNLTDRQIEEVS